MRAFITVHALTIGFTIEEQAVAGRRIDADRYPLAAAAGPGIFGTTEERFAHGLRLIIAGVEGYRTESR